MKRPLDRALAALGAAFAVVTAILALTASAGSGGATASSGGAPAGTGDSVTIQGFAYQAVNLQVKVGTKVTWTNQDSAEHTATADDGSTFDTGTLKQGQSKVLTLTKAGRYPYHCSFHPFMHGTIAVR